MINAALGFKHLMDLSLEEGSRLGYMEYEDWL